MSARDRILGALPSESPRPARRNGERLPQSPASWAEFRARFEELGGRVVNWEDLADWVDGPVLVDGDALPLLPEGVLPHRTDDPWQAKLGVTLCDAAVASTGSLLLKAGPGRRRLASLAPNSHLALIPPLALCGSLTEALERSRGRTSVLISGPSRTADIEGILIHGVHGPREVLALLLES